MLRQLMSGIVAFGLLGSGSSQIVSRNASTTKPTAQQSLALDLIERARVLSTHSTPAIHAYLCQEAERARSRVPRLDNTAQLRECFQETLLLDPSSPLRRFIQMQVVSQLGSAAADQVSDLLAGADPKVRSVLIEQTIQKHLAEKRWDDGLALLAQAPRDENFPYSSAVNFMLALPGERSADKRTVFALALQSYKNQQSTPPPDMEDLGTMVVRFWRILPPHLVMDAIDEFLNTAKKDDSGKRPIALSVGTAKGEAHFGTVYFYRLFELLPIIREIDSSRAKSLESDAPQLRAVLQSYPKGLTSLEPSFTDQEPAPGEVRRFTITYSLKGGGEQDDQEIPSEYDRLARRVEEVSGQVIADPAKLGTVLNLPAHYPDGLKSPKADALGAIAVALSQKDPKTSREALRMLRSSLVDLSPIAKCHYLTGMANIYLRLNDFESADSVLAEAAKQGGEVYKQDTSEDDPNSAFKLYWPSNAVFRTTVVLMGRISRAKAAKTAEDLPDSDLSSSALLALASDLLGNSPIGSVIETNSKSNAMHGSFPLSR